MDIEAIAEEWKAKGRLAEAPEEVRMELCVMQVHVLDLPAEWFVPAYEGMAAFLRMLEAGAPGVRADLSDGSFRAEWTLRRTGTDGLGVFSVKYPDFQCAETVVRVEDFVAEGKEALQAFLSEDIIHDEGRCYFAAYQAEPMTTADAWSAAAALAVWNDLRSARWLFPSPQAAWRAELRRFFSDEALLREGVRSVQDDAGRILYGARSGEERAEARHHLTETLAAWNACRGADWLFPLPLAALSPKDFLNAVARRAAGV